MVWHLAGFLGEWHRPGMVALSICMWSVLFSSPSILSMSALAQHQLHRDGGGEVPIADGYCEGAVAVSRAASEVREGGFCCAALVMILETRSDGSGDSPAARSARSRSQPHIPLRDAEAWHSRRSSFLHTNKVD